MSDYEITNENGNPGLSLMAGADFDWIGGRSNQRSGDPNGWIKAAAGEPPAAD